MKKIEDMNMAELGAFVCTHLKRNGIRVVLTGGACVFLYADGKYVSYDLDFIEDLSAGRRKLKRILKQIEFEEQGRYFRHPDSPYFLEFPSGPLAVGEERPREIRVLKFATGELSALSPTDCIKDRLAAFFHWNDRECLEQALLVARENDINLAEIERWSLKEGHGEKFQLFTSQLER